MQILEDNRNFLLDCIKYIIPVLNGLGKESGAPLKRFMITLFKATLFDGVKGEKAENDSIYFAVSMLKRIALEAPKLGQSIIVDNSRIPKKRFFEDALTKQFIKFNRSNRVAITIDGQIFCLNLINDNLQDPLIREKLTPIIERFKVETSGRNPFIISRRSLGKVEELRLKVSCLIISVNKLDIRGTMQKLSSALNVQLLENNHEIPYVSPNNFVVLKQSNKLFLHGRSGSGKSRAIYETICSEIAGYEKIYVINPNRVLGKNAFSEDIFQLSDRFDIQDCVIWDNFPLDLVLRSYNNAKFILEKLSLCKARKMMISLNPHYPHTYTEICNCIPEIDCQEIVYSVEDLESLTKSFGVNIDQFNSTYQRYVEEKVHDVATNLWKKEPTPLIILEYYKQLLDSHSQLSNGSVNVLTEVKKLKSMTRFYENQFEYHRHSAQSPNLHFLYTLKLCYEMGLDRDLGTLKRLQESIFQTDMPTEPTQGLGSWVYLSGAFYSMHDIARESVQFSQDILLRIMNYFRDNHEIIQGDETTLYQSGNFIGKNISYLLSEKDPMLLPHKLSILTQKGERTSSELARLLREMQKESLNFDIISNLEKLGGDLTISDLERFANDTGLSERIPNIGEDSFSMGFGYGLGQALLMLSKDVIDRVWNLATGLLKRNADIAIGFGMGLGQALPMLSQEIEGRIWKKIVDIAIKNKYFGGGFGGEVAQFIESISVNDFENILYLTVRDYAFAVSLGMVCASRLLQRQLDSQMAQRIDQLLEKSASFRSGVNQILSLAIFDTKFRTTLNKSIPSLRLPGRWRPEVCPVCGERLVDNAIMAIDHLLYNHYDYFKAYHVTMVCSECGVVENGFDRLLKHIGDRHYNSLPSGLKEIYDKQKARRFSVRRDG